MLTMMATPRDSPTRVAPGHLLICHQRRSGCHGRAFVAVSWGNESWNSNGRIDSFAFYFSLSILRWKLALIYFKQKINCWIINSLILELINWWINRHGCWGWGWSAMVDPAAAPPYPEALILNRRNDCPGDNPNLGHETCHQRVIPMKAWMFMNENRNESINTIH